MRLKRDAAKCTTEATTAKERNLNLRRTSFPPLASELRETAPHARRAVAAPSPAPHADARMAYARSKYGRQDGWSGLASQQPANKK